jgi:hypothetical protein
LNLSTLKKHFQYFHTDYYDLILTKFPNMSFSSVFKEIHYDPRMFKFIDLNTKFVPKFNVESLQIEKNNFEIFTKKNEKLFEPTKAENFSITSITNNININSNNNNKNINEGSTIPSSCHLRYDSTNTNKVNSTLNMFDLNPIVNNNQYLNQTLSDPLTYANRLLYDLHYSRFYNNNMFYLNGNNYFNYPI